MKRSPLFFKGVANEALQSIIPCTGLCVPNYGLQSINAEAQVHWRKHAQHQGNIVDEHPLLADTLKPHFEALGLVGVVEPSKQHYDCVFVFGAYWTGVSKRLDFLRSRGTAFNRLILLGSARVANPTKESLRVLNNDVPGGVKLMEDQHPLIAVPPTEATIMQAMMYRLEVPGQWTNRKVLECIQTPLRKEGEKRDPSAEDTLRYWMESTDNRSFGDALMVYSQPGVLQNQLMCQKILGTNVESAGYDTFAGKPINVSQTLDTLAKIIYEMAQPS